MIKVGDAFAYMTRKYYVISVNMDSAQVWLSDDPHDVPRDRRYDWELKTAEDIASCYPNEDFDNWLYVPAYPNRVQLPPGV